MKANKALRGVRIAAALFLVVCCGLEISGRGQSSTTDLDGLSVEAGAVYHSRDSNNPHCLLHLKVFGPKVSLDSTASIIETTRISDNTGRILDPITEDWEHYEGLGQTIALKCPAPDARSIEVEGKANLLTPTIPQLVFSNLETRGDQTLKHPLLQENHIVIRILQSRASSRRGVDIETEDPDSKLEFVGFLKDGELWWGKDRTQFGAKKTESFDFVDTDRLSDLKLAVKVKSPLKATPFHFKIGSIPLPWLQPTKMEVTVKEMKAMKWLTNSYGCAINLNFKGGPLTNALGIYRVSITHAESEQGQKFDVKSQMYEGGLFEHDAGLDDLTKRTDLDSGGTVTKVLCLFAKQPNPKSISILEGDAEIFSPTVENGGFVCFTNQLVATGEMAVMSPLKEYRVSMKFLGFHNFYSKRTELGQMSGAHSSGINVLDSAQTPITTKDSLLFSFDDPQDVILSWENEFFDAFGKQTYSRSSVQVSRLCLIGGFDSMPVRTRFMLHIASPQSLQRVHFKVENVPLP